MEYNTPTCSFSICDRSGTLAIIRSFDFGVFFGGGFILVWDGWRRLNRKKDYQNNQNDIVL
jgi:hypothetical protein